MYTHEEFFSFHNGVSGDYGGENWEARMLWPCDPLQDWESIQYVSLMAFWRTISLSFMVGGFFIFAFRRFLVA